MSERSHILVVADGGTKLREALEARFPNLTFHQARLSLFVTPLKTVSS